MLARRLPCPFFAPARAAQPEPAGGFAMPWLRATSLACALACAALNPVAAQTDQQRSVREAVSSGRYKPLADILRIAEQHIPGRVLEVEMETSRVYGPVYEIEVLDHSNRKREIKLQAETGQLVELDDTPVAQSGLMPLPSILRQLAQQHPGQVVEAELQASQQQQAVYELKLLQPDGQQQALVVDARSGAILRGAPNPGQAAGQMLPLEQILERLLDQFPGTVMEVELERERSHSGDTWYYEIDIRLQQGGTMELHVDPHNAAVLRQKRKE